MRAWRNAGITTLRVYPAGQTLAERLTTLGRKIDIVEEFNRYALAVIKGLRPIYPVPPRGSRSHSNP